MLLRVVLRLSGVETREIHHGLTPVSFLTGMKLRLTAKRRAVCSATHFLEQIRQRPELTEENRSILDEYRRCRYWEVVNIAVKGSGLLKSRNHLEWLINLLLDRHAVGFLRRNAAESLAMIGSVSPAVIQALCRGLSDSYWEVRSQCANSLGALGFVDPAAEQALLNALLKPAASSPPSGRLRIAEKNFEICMNIAKALGEVGSAVCLPAIETLLDHPNWQVRCMALGALKRLWFRRVISRQRVCAAIDNIDLTAEGFTPNFPLTACYKEVVEALNEEDGRSACSSSSKPLSAKPELQRST